MDIKDDTQKRARLLHYAGERVFDIFDTPPETGEDKDYEKAKEDLTKYFSPTKNQDFEVYKFRQVPSQIMKALMNTMHACANLLHPASLLIST